MFLMNKQIQDQHLIYKQSIENGQQYKERNYYHKYQHQNI